MLHDIYVSWDQSPSQLTEKTNSLLLVGKDQIAKVFYFESSVTYSLPFKYFSLRTWVPGK